MRKYPKLKYPSHEKTDGLFTEEVVVTEKLDGANFRFTFTNGGEIVSGSRNVTFTENGDPLPLEEVNAAFRHAINYLRNTATPSNLTTYDPSNLTIYGEAMHLHSLEYPDFEYEAPESGSAYPGGENPNVVAFDVRHKEHGWLDWPDVESVVDALGLTLTRVIGRGDRDYLEEIGALTIPSESMFGGSPEGIVVRQVTGSVRAKKVSEDFKEKNATSFNDPGKASTTAGKFVAKYVTDARIEKTAHKLVDRGEYDSLKMDMMADLPRAVLEDVMAEEGWEVLTNEMELTIDAKGAVRSKASGKCASVLKQEINSF